jgi:hypothetical protein
MRKPQLGQFEGEPLNGSPQAGQAFSSASRSITAVAARWPSSSSPSRKSASIRCAASSA